MGLSALFVTCIVTAFLPEFITIFPDPETISPGKLSCSSSTKVSIEGTAEINTASEFKMKNLFFTLNAQKTTFLCSSESNQQSQYTMI